MRRTSVPARHVMRSAAPGQTARRIKEAGESRPLTSGGASLQPVVRKCTIRQASKGQQDVKARERATKLERRSLTLNAKKTAGKLFQARGASPLPPRPRRLVRAAAAESALPGTAAAAAGADASAAAGLPFAPTSGIEYAGLAVTAPEPPLPPLPVLVAAPEAAATRLPVKPGVNDGALLSRPRLEEEKSAVSEKD